MEQKTLQTVNTAPPPKKKIMPETSTAICQKTVEEVYYTNLVTHISQAANQSSDKTEVARRWMNEKQYALFISSSSIVINIILILLTSTPGNGVTSDPVAIMMFFAVTVSELPSSLRTVTSLGPVIFP